MITDGDFVSCLKLWKMALRSGILPQWIKDRKTTRWFRRLPIKHWIHCLVFIAWISQCISAMLLKRYFEIQALLLRQFSTNSRLRIRNIFIATFLFSILGKQAMESILQSNTGCSLLGILYSPDFASSLQFRTWPL